jgi:nitroreductase
MDAIQAIKTRRSIRVFRPGAVPRETLIDLVDCARLAPSGMNQQPWEFIIVTERAAMQRMAGLIPYASPIGQAAACIAVLCKPNTFYVEDGSAATMNILLGATAHGLGACWVSGDKQPYAEAIREVLTAPASLRLFSVIAVGFPAETPKPEKRKLEAMVHWERW